MTSGTPCVELIPFRYDSLASIREMEQNMVV